VKGKFETLWPSPLQLYMAAITKQLTAVSSLCSTARFVQLHTVDTRVPPMNSAAEVEGELHPYYQVMKDEQEMILKVNLPGVDNECTKVWVEDMVLFASKLLDGTLTSFSLRIMKEIFSVTLIFIYWISKSQFSNGVLKIIVPKKTGT